MKFSLKTRVAVFITLLVLVISSISTFLFITAHSRSKERGLVARGAALSYSLSKAAEDGLLKEDLDLIKKASYIIKAPDVALVQVYSNIWEPIDAYPIVRMKDAPHPSALHHFTVSSSPFSIRTNGSYGFYSPVIFKASEDSPQIVIGFTRIELSFSGIQRELRYIVATNLIISAGITLLAVFSINILISRLVVRPVMALHKSVSLFRRGGAPEFEGLPRWSADELKDLSGEFGVMCRTIREKEERLVSSEGRIRSLFERVEHALFRLDSRGKVVESNRRFKELFGDAKELCEIMIGDGVSSDCLKRAGEERVLSTEKRVAGKDGNDLIVSLALYPDIDSGGKVAGYDGYIMDITEKKRMEERLIRAQKMEAVGTLAGGMAHDFNNLLTAILGYSEIILSMTKEGDPMYKAATIINEAAMKGADFGRKILAITRQDKIEARPLDINDVVKGAMELLSRSFPKSIEIVTDLGTDLPRIKADPSQLQQVVMNLAVNARDAMPNGGKLVVETAAVGKEDGVANDTPAGKGGFIKLSVWDTGTGIDAATQSRIFDPFFTTKEVGKGTGLGLYIVHSIINNHGGYINLYSEPRMGTKFNIYLPVTTEAWNEETVDASSLRGSGTILVIDDEPDVRGLCKDLLVPLGYSVIEAASGPEGVNIFRERGGAISLVILDMIMPKMGGGEVFRALKTINPDVRVLLCSGYSPTGFSGIEDLLKSGAAGFVQKPFSRQNIALAIRKAMKG